VGKSALIEAAASYAVSAGVRLLRATGTQFEAHVSFAGLHQLLFDHVQVIDTVRPGGHPGDD
jgi:hypothetical protein